MRIEMQVDAAGAEVLEARAGRVASRPVLEAAAQIMRDDVLAQFQRGGDPPWAPLSPRTVAAKRAAVEAAAQIMRDDVLAQFQRGGDPPWAPLSPRTVAAKRAAGYPRLNRRGEPPKLLMQNGNFGPENILMRTGALLTSWTQKGDPHHVKLVDEQSGEVAIGSSLPYAPTHQRGGRGFRGSAVPARPVRLRSEAVERIARLISEQMEQ